MVRSVTEVIDDLIAKLPWNRIPTAKRSIYANKPELNSLPSNHFCSNKVSTSKYSILSFVPKNLFEQFTRVANIYFLIVSCLQLFTGLSPTGRWGTVVPLILVVLFQMLKDGFEDAKRHIADRQVNHKTTKAIRNGQLVDVRWIDVKVGDILEVNQEEAFPADMICISTSENQGLCYIETSQLDGETNLKIRRAHKTTMYLTSVEDITKLDANVTCEAPNNKLYNFTGNIQIGEDGKSIPIDVEQILLRGALLKNTRRVYGLVIFTGKHTKLMMNSRNPPHKRSRVEQITNYCIIFLFICQIAITIACSIGIGVWNRLHSNHQYIFHGRMLKPVQVSFRGLITFFILFNNFIPISLYVSMEFVKMLQARLFIDNDIDMYYEEDDIAPSAKTSSLNEELGQVKHIFSDKTGTLTQNKMEFLKFSVNACVYGKGTTEVGRAAALREGKEIKEDEIPTDWNRPPDFAFYDDRILGGKWKCLEESEAISEFFTLLAVCHTVIPEVDRNDPSKIIYQASSPDEAALVNAARHLGFCFHTRTPDSVTIRVDNVEQTFNILNVLEFNSTRKRMSVIVRNPNNQIILYTKGADNVIYERLKSSNTESESTREILKEFAAAGLRTLVCAKAILSEPKYIEWNELFEQASTSLENKEQKLAEVAELIERDLSLVGTTAIEDKLQDGVPEAISRLQQANIKVFVLTGDKQETAINIGFACALLNNQMGTIILNTENRRELKQIIRKQLKLALEGKIEGQEHGLGLVIDGKSLDYVLPSSDEALASKSGSESGESFITADVDDPNEEPLRITFLNLCMLCKSVICCRVSPLQKSLVVKLVKDRYPSAITLAIGDGANDVSMIQAAHIGIGIAGQEGLQAARASDYAIGQFRFLTKLLFVHGRWSYRRLGKLICYSFYKNIVLQLTQFWYVFFNGYTGTSLYDSISLSLFNVLFTSAPIVGYALFDRDVSVKTSMKFPELYIDGQKDSYFNLKLFITWIMNAVYHSILCFFIPYGAYRYGLLNGGHVADREVFGTTIYTCVILVVTLKVGLESYSWTFIHHLVIWLSILVWFIFQVLYSVAWEVVPGRRKGLKPVEDSTREYYFTFYNTAQNAHFWFILLFTVVVALLRDFVWEAFVRNFPLTRQLYHVLQEVDSDGKIHPEQIHDHFDMSSIKPSRENIKEGKYITCQADETRWAFKSSKNIVSVQPKKEQPFNNPR